MKVFVTRPACNAYFTKLLYHATFETKQYLITCKRLWKEDTRYLYYIAWTMNML